MFRNLCANIRETCCYSFYLIEMLNTIDYTELLRLHCLEAPTDWVRLISQKYLQKIIGWQVTGVVVPSNLLQNKILDDKIEYFFCTSSTTYIHVRNSVSLMTKCIKLSQFYCIYWSLELLCDDWLLAEYWNTWELNCAADVKIISLMVAHAALWMIICLCCLEESQILFCIQIFNLLLYIYAKTHKLQWYYII